MKGKLPVVKSKKRTIPNFFFNEDRYIKFQWNGRPYPLSNIRTNIYAATLSKMLEGGANHMLTYFFETNPTKYYDICHHFMFIYFEAANDVKETIREDDNYPHARVVGLKKYCVLDEYLIDAICEYVKATTVENVEESEATTDVTLLNIHCNILNCIAMAIKFSYIYGSLFLGNMRFDEAVNLFADELTVRVLERVGYHYGVENIEEFVTDMHNYLDEFIFKRVDSIWNKRSDFQFRSKFEETGRDVFHYAVQHKYGTYNSLKQYFPALRNESLVKKYADKDTKELKEIYYTVEKDWKDFAFVNKNTVGYLQFTLDNVVEKQDTVAPLPNVNIPEFISGGAGESSNSKNRMLEEDKLSFLYDLRKETCVKSFQSFVTEIMKLTKRYNLSNLGYITRHIVTDNNHPLNQFIISKILLSLTGELQIYRMIYGDYLKIFLLLFYLKIKFEYAHNKNFNWIKPYVDAMVMTPVTISTNDKEQLRDFLDKEGYPFIKVDAFDKIARTYSRDGMDSIEVSKECVLDLYDFLSDPYRLRNFLFPSMYGLNVNEEQEVYNQTSGLTSDEVKKHIKILVPNYDKLRDKGEEVELTG